MFILSFLRNERVELLAAGIWNFLSSQITKIWLLRDAWRAISHVRHRRASFGTFHLLLVLSREQSLVALLGFVLGFRKNSVHNSTHCSPLFNYFTTATGGAVQWKLEECCPDFSSFFSPRKNDKFMHGKHILSDDCKGRKNSQFSPASSLSSWE